MTEPEALTLSLCPPPGMDYGGLHDVRLRRAPSPVLFNELVGVRVSTELLYGLGV
jgi:hypothetical protein